MYEVWLFAILIGMWFCALFLITGILIGRGVKDAKGNAERTNSVDSDIRIYVPCRNRTRSSDKRDNPQVEERLNVLQTLRVGASREEKIVLDYYIDHIRSEIEMDIMNKYKFYCDNEDFKLYVDKCAKTYNKTINEILESPITEEYYSLLREKEKATKNEN